MARDSVRFALDDLSSVAASIITGETACILEVSSKNRALLLGTAGCDAEVIQGQTLIPGLDSKSRPVVYFPDLRAEQWFSKSALYTLAPFAVAMIAAVVPRESANHGTYLVAFSHNSVASQQGVVFSLYSQIAKIAGRILKLGASPEEKAGGLSLSGFAETTAPTSNLAAKAGGEASVVAFLLNTLVKETRLRKRGQTSYITFRRWKSLVKDAQIAALRGLKLDVSQVMAEAIASELASEVSAILTLDAFTAVVPVPCGSSGRERCFSVALAKAIAARTGLPMRLWLDGEVRHGASHPHKSRTLAPYRTVGSPKGHVLLVDDVATTGNHLDAAARSLRESGVTASAIAWIGG